MDTEIMTIKEKTAYRLAREGKIPGLKVGGAWRFRQSKVEAWIDRQLSERKESAR